MRWSPRVTVAAVIQRGERFLMVEEAPDGRAVINQPAGHLEEGETLLDAVIRETREETAWGFLPKGLVGIYRWQVPTNGNTYLRFCFHGNCVDHQPEQALDSDILRIHWLTRQSLESQPERLRSPMVLRCIDHYLAGSSHPLDMLHELA